MCHFHRKPKPLPVLPSYLTHLGLRSSSRAAAGGEWTLNQGRFCQRVPFLPRDSRVCAVPGNLTAQGLGAEQGQQRHRSAAEENTAERLWTGINNFVGITNAEYLAHLQFGSSNIRCKIHFSCVGQQIPGMFSGFVCHWPTKNYSATIFRVDGSGI